MFFLYFTLFLLSIHTVNFANSQQLPTLYNILNQDFVSDVYQALIDLLATTPLYDETSPFVVINDTSYPLVNQYLNYTPDALEFVVPFLLRFNGKISEEKALATSVVLGFTALRKFFLTLKAFPKNFTTFVENYGRSISKRLVLNEEKSKDKDKIMFFDKFFKRKIKKDCKKKFC
jgi:hypothetical protein